MAVFMDEKEKGKLHVKYIICECTTDEIMHYIKDMYFDTHFDSRRSVTCFKRNNELKVIDDQSMHGHYLQYCDDRYKYSMAICKIARIENAEPSNINTLKQSYDKHAVRVLFKVYINPDTICKWHFYI